MPETDHFTGYCSGFEFDFVKRETTPRPLMKFSIPLYTVVLSLSNTVSVFDSFGVDRCRTTVYKRMRTADL